MLAARRQNFVQLASTMWQVDRPVVPLTNTDSDHYTNHLTIHEHSYMYGYTNQYSSGKMEYPPITIELRCARIQKSHSITITHAQCVQSHVARVTKRTIDREIQTWLAEEYQLSRTQHELESSMYSYRHTRPKSETSCYCIYKECG